MVCLSLYMVFNPTIAFMSRNNEDIRSLRFILAGVGIGTSFFGFVGCYSVLRANQQLLLIQLFFIGMMLILDIIIFVFPYYFLGSLRDTILSDIFHSNETALEDGGLDKIQKYIGCCGIQPLDWQSVPNPESCCINPGSCSNSSATMDESLLFTVGCEEKLGQVLTQCIFYMIYTLSGICAINVISMVLSFCIYYFNDSK